jgi:hypothetical protein
MGTFYLGIHRPAWLGKVQVPCFVSHRILRDVVALPRATCAWALDSGGFTQLNLEGRWTERAKTYARFVRRYQEWIGNLQWAAIQDWMCEDKVRCMTGLATPDHQILTVQSYMALMDAAPDLPWAPVLQGQRPGDYLAHLELYDRWGLDPNQAPACGVGSVCRRQGMAEALEILLLLRGAGIYNLHGFGFKITGLAQAGLLLDSADSMAWSLAEFKRGTGLQNDLPTAMAWRERVLSKAGWLDWNDQPTSIRTPQLQPLLLEGA